ncbi:trypsin-like serine protease [Vibrio hepatarius]|uniref:trypsin-like serine protease n=1 Tax=Vibrio hepatarius TaxID=171383 RepID=UPI00142E5004|nr:trypsin-like serine protease [Vibrio hepatarius]NIY83152.1 trypsin-like serine protease [Vibrio hepatarius]
MIRWHFSALVGAATCAIAAPSIAQDFSPRIIDGTAASSVDWPYMTALVKRGASAYEGQFCGGSYIGDRYILTAAHCVEGQTTQDFEVIVGINNLNHEETEGVRLTPQQIYIHPAYSNLANDIAIIELPRVLAADEATPVDIADSNTRSNTPDGTDMTVAGWGSTTPEYGNHTTSAELLEVTVPMVDQAVCAATFASVADSTDSDNFCAGYAYEGYDSCRGDSGGPLVIDSSGVQLGIVSFGSQQCGEVNSYGVYTNISLYTDWIAQITSGLSYSEMSPRAYKETGTNTHEFVLKNFSDSAITIDSVVAANDIAILTDSCTGAIQSGSACTVTVSFNSPNYEKQTLAITVNYTANGTAYSVELEAQYEIAIARSSALADALSISNVDVYSNEYPWQITSNGLRSAPIAHSQRSSVIFEGIPSGYYEFDLKVSSEAADTVDLYVNGEYVDGIGGEYTLKPWVYLPSYSNSVKFEYQKDGSIDIGDDAAYISNFRKANFETQSDRRSSGGGGGSLGWLTLTMLLPLLRRK